MTLSRIDGDHGHRPFLLGGARGVGGAHPTTWRRASAAIMLLQVAHQGRARSGHHGERARSGITRAGASMDLIGKRVFLRFPKFDFHFREAEVVSEVAAGGKGYTVLWVQRDGDDSADDDDDDMSVSVSDSSVALDGFNDEVTVDISPDAHTVHAAI